MAKLKVAEALREGLKAFGPNGENWVNHFPNDDSGTQCMLSAIQESVSPIIFSECELMLARAVHGRTEPMYRNLAVSSWNDHKKRTWLEVKAAYEQAIAAAEQP